MLLGEIKLRFDVRNRPWSFVPDHEPVPRKSSSLFRHFGPRFLVKERERTIEMERRMRRTRSRAEPLNRDPKHEHFGAG